MFTYNEIDQKSNIQNEKDQVYVKRRTIYDL